MHTRLRVGQAFDNGDEKEGRPASLHIRRTQQHTRFSTYLLRLQALEPILRLLLPKDDKGPAVLVKDQRHGCVLKAAGSLFSSSKFCSTQKSLRFFFSLGGWRASACACGGGRGVRQSAHDDDEDQGMMLVLMGAKVLLVYGQGKDEKI